MSDRPRLPPTAILPKPKLDRPSGCIPSGDWEAGISFISYGLHIGIRVNDPDVLMRLADYLPPGWEPSPLPVVDKLYSLIVGGTSRNASGSDYSGLQPDEVHLRLCSGCINAPATQTKPEGCASLAGNSLYHLLYDEEGELARGTELSRVLHALDSHLRLWIGTSVQDRLFVHAGVVAWRNRAIVIPGRSFSGKTTLVAALVKAGAVYYSDEYAVFDSDGLVHPYPRALSVRQGSGDRIKTCPVAELGGKSGSEPLSVGLVVSAQYQSGAQWHPNRMTPGEAVLALLDNTLVARLRPQFALPILARAVSDTLAIQGKRGEAEEVAVALLQQLEE